MAISEAQLETWSHQGKTGQFTATYNSIRDDLLDASVPYLVKNLGLDLRADPAFAIVLQALSLHWRGPQ